MFKVKNIIDVYEINGRDIHAQEDRKFKIHSHQNNPKYVVVFFDDKEQFTVLIEDLLGAAANIKRAGN